MRRISTGVEQLLTADDIADVVLSYATALARAGTADTVSIPIVRDDGETDEARLLLGPASQLTIVPDSDVEIELPAAAAVVADLQQRIERLSPRPVVEQPPTDTDDATFPDFDEWV